ncbi:hypothetical protein P4S83_13005 [Aneurinibacillus thermoaerophilus]|uniref:hypothetical protein n=1 Tax=Aneurinibacillus thermoaerophilus TaxID=143495 RepID=UPI002E1D0CE3|nr:hypothetical protein [Aneurinibacillus thermoaerophilus]MED0763491.1 hypothetical protein [Aneurinibacillus thermoaerophilus]
MRRKMYRVVDAIVDFYKLLEKHHDESQHYYIFTSFFKGLLREKAIGETLPIIELITILKHEKPTIFFTMKKQKEHWLDIISSVELDIEEAKERLKRMIDENSLR